MSLPKNEEAPQPDTKNAPNEEQKQENINDFGIIRLPDFKSNIHVLPVIGQVEGHLIVPPQNKTTKYEHIIPQLVAVEQSPDIKALLIILNTVGGDVEAGLAIAEMIASMDKPTASLVLGGGHSIGVPIAVSAGRSFIAETATMTIHPIRLTGLVLGVQQSFDYLDRMQDRIINFIASHSSISAEKFRSLMTNTGELATDIGTIVVGKEAVEIGLIDEVGGLNSALCYLRSEIKKRETSDQPEPCPGAEQEVSGAGEGE